MPPLLQCSAQFVTQGQRLSSLPPCASTAAASLPPSKLGCCMARVKQCLAGSTIRSTMCSQMGCSPIPTSIGWRALQTALGNFDATKGGHLVLWDLKLVVEFPPGAPILLPSATITHSNVPVQLGEEQASFTQFSAGDIFHYIDNNFQTVKELQSEEPAEYECLMAKRASRWEHGLSLLSTLHELLAIYFHNTDWPQNLGGISRRNLTTVKFSGCLRRESNLSALGKCLPGANHWILRPSRIINGSALPSMKPSKNADKQHEAAKLRLQHLCAGIAKSDYHTQWKYCARAAEHSEQYCDRQAKRERVERKQEADALQASHRAAPTTFSTQGPRLPPKKMLHAHPLHTSLSQRALREKLPDNKEDGDSNKSDAACRCLDEPFFPGRIAPRTAIGMPCPGCGLYNCPSCVCMCTESTEWVDHLGGHFFPDCKKCVGTECPGCACVCKYSTEWVEHGGHTTTNTGGFFAIVHEQWKGVVMSKKTRDCMLDAYVGTSTFTLPYPGPLGSLPTEDAHRREADFKERLLHSFALNRVPLVPTSQEDLGELFTTFLGVSASNIEECMEVRIAEEIEEVLASDSFSSVYTMTPAMAQLSGTFNAHAHTDRCANQWAEAMAQCEDMGRHNGEGTQRVALSSMVKGDMVAKTLANKFCCSIHAHSAANLSGIRSWKLEAAVVAHEASFKSAAKGQVTDGLLEAVCVVDGVIRWVVQQFA
ncbi:hypothetical protein K438DRAFT_1752612 [Mycena galopus ATCC 62051]|nr:hypothetical protein K438DRAFT_1752612 [Mycena galopus ATCC 62051]